MPDLTDNQPEKTFADIKRECSIEEKDRLEKKTKILVKAIVNMIDIRKGYIKRREEEIEELGAILIDIEKAYDENRERKIDALKCKIRDYDVANAGRSRNGNY